MGVPILASNPIGWAIIGAAGFLTYKVGKRSGLKTEEELDKPGITDRAIKGVMKTVYRTQKSVGEGLQGTKVKYGTMWAEAQSEVQDPK